MTGITFESRGDTFIINSESEMELLSSAVLNGGRRSAKHIINHTVPKNFNHVNPEVVLTRVAKKLALNVNETTGMMTAAKTSKTTTARRKGIFVAVTAGTSNAAAAGDSPAKYGAGTINTIVVMDGVLDEPAFAGMIQTVTEAKVMALRNLDIRSCASHLPATGTTTDATLIASTARGKRHRYAGTATDIGASVSIVVTDAITKAILDEQGTVAFRPLQERLRDRGITIDDMVSTAMELYIHHPSMGSIKDVRKKLKKIMSNNLNDINISAMFIAGMRAEEDGKAGLIPGITPELFASDPVHLVADELIGMEIAQYIAGSRGLFEYMRFDRKKPGILKNLEPFMDDLVGSFIGGCSSLLYTQLMEGKDGSD